jgi:hypothetical protein
MSTYDNTPNTPQNSDYQPSYVRPRKARRTVDSIDDLQYDDNTQAGGYVNDSNVTVRGGMLTGGSYRRSRAKVTKLQHSSRYGQYLEIPKGKRSILVSRERARRRNSVIIMILIVAAIVLVVIFAIQLILSGIH